MACGIAAAILLLLAFALPVGSRRVSMTSATSVAIKSVEKALEYYAKDHGGAYPNGRQEVWDLLMQPSEVGDTTYAPYLDEQPEDAWGEVLFYQYPPTHNADSPDIWSSGPDRLESGDDIRNW